MRTKWLFGSTALTNISKINSRLKQASLQRAREEIDKPFDFYQPWMSSYEHRKRFSILSVLKQQETVQVISDLDELRLLRQAFSANGDGADIKCLYSDDSNRCIMSGSDTGILDFKASFNRVLLLLHNSCRDYRVLLSETIDQIIPVTSVDPQNRPLRVNGSGLTTHNYRGGIFISCAVRSEVSDFENLLNLVHELGHSTFNVYLSCDEVIAGADKMSMIYSVIRKTHRPALLSFHALIASAFMYDFCCRYRHVVVEIVNPDYLQQRMSGLENDIKTGLNNCMALNFTDLGRQFFKEISELVEFKNRFPK